jgi:hypothetical protein
VNKTIIPLLVAVGGLVAGSLAYGGDTGGGVAVELKAGTLGGGVEVNYALSPKFTVGAGLNSFSRSKSDTADNIDYDFDLNLQTLALLANFHPFSGAFRLTAGVMHNGNEVKMKAKPTASYDIGGQTYTAAQVGSLGGKVDFNTLAPYLGLGWGKSAARGIGATFDLGVLFQGSPNVSLTASGGTLSNDPTFQANLKQEEANAEDDIKGFTLYPVISLGVNYRF